MKTCIVCKETKSLEHFNLRNSSRKTKATHQSYCKDCNKYVARKWRTTENGKKSTKNSKRKTRGRVYRFIGRILRKSRCGICGESDPTVLQFDHVDPAKKQTEISKMQKMHVKSLYALKEEIRKCRILCANCHMRHTAKQQNNWRHRVFVLGEEL